MKLSILTLLLIFFSISVTRAQTSEKDLAGSIDALNKAMISQDKTILETLTSAELSYGHSTGLVENQAEFLKDVLSGPVKFSSIENSDLKISLAGNAAIARCLSAIKGINNNAPMDVKIGILMIWVNQGDHWKLLARQGYKLPQ
jgi:Domain of unknown function (DUF4440)